MVLSGENTTNIQFVMVPLEKARKHLRLQWRGWREGVDWGGSKGQKVMSAGLLLSKIFRKRKGEVGACLTLLFHTQCGQNRPDNFENIFLTKALSGKYLKEKC